MGWISVLVAVAIGGMGGAPIAEKFQVFWLMHTLKWTAWIACALLAVATLLVGGMGVYHGLLTVVGKSPGSLKNNTPSVNVPKVPVVESTPGDARP